MPNRGRTPTRSIETDVSNSDQAPRWYQILPAEVRFEVYRYLLLSYPTSVRPPYFRIASSAAGPQLARLDCWKYIKNEIPRDILYSHIFLGTYSQKRGMYHHHPGEHHPNDAKLPVEKCIPQVEMGEKVQKISARYNQRFGPGNAMEDIFTYVSSLKKTFSNLETVEFTVVIQKWVLWLPILEHGLVADVESWLRPLGEAPEGLTVLLELGNRTPGIVAAWNERGQELFKNFDRDIVNKALRRVSKSPAQPIAADGE